MTSSTRQHQPAGHTWINSDHVLGIKGHWIIGFALAIAIGLGLFRLNQYPAMWFDEGSYLEVARNLAEGKGYAALSADGEADYAPVISLGPSVMLPLAGAIWLNGNTIFGVRLLAVIFMVVATWMYFRIARHVFGTGVATVGLIVLFTMPAIQWVFHGRHVVGEMPAVTFLLLGGALVFRASTPFHILLAGTVLGLAMVTKPLFALMLPVIIIVTAAIDMATHKIRDVRWYALVLAGASVPAIFWAIGLAWIIGFHNVPDQISILATTSGQSVATTDPNLLIDNLRHIFGPPGYFLVVPAFLAGLLAYHRSSGDRKLMILSMLVLQAVWFPWFIFISAGWTRYVFPALTISTIFFGVLAMYALEAYRHVIKKQFMLPGWALRAPFILALLLSVALLGLGADRTIKPVLIYGSNDAAEFASAMDSIISSDASVAGWQPELNYLSSRPLHYPPVGTLATALEKARLDQVGVPEEIPPPPTTDYLVIGDVSRWLGLYDWHIESDEYTLILTVGQYDLYERDDTSRSSE